MDPIILHYLRRPLYPTLNIENSRLGFDFGPSQPALEPILNNRILESWKSDAAGAEHRPAPGRLAGTNLVAIATTREELHNKNKKRIMMFVVFLDFLIKIITINWTAATAGCSLRSGLHLVRGAAEGGGSRGKAKKIKYIYIHI